MLTGESVFDVRGDDRELAHNFFKIELKLAVFVKAGDDFLRVEALEYRRH